MNPRAGALPPGAARAEPGPGDAGEPLAEPARGPDPAKARSQADWRASILSLTETGRQALTEDLSQRASWLADALGELTETEQQLLVLASQLMNRLADTPAGSPPGREQRREVGGCA